MPRTLTAKLFNEIEEAFQEQNKISNNLEQLQKVCKTRLVYDSSWHYKKTWIPLIKLEEQYEKQLKESQCKIGVNVRWDISMKRKIAYFLYPKEDSEYRILPGDELLLKVQIEPGKEWQSSGNVIKMTQNEEIALEIRDLNPPTDIKKDYVVEFVWKSTSFDRMVTALNVMHRDQSCMTNYIYRKILGHEVNPQKFKISYNPKMISVENLPLLNSFQANAIKKSIQEPLMLIQGPPGTGKTVTSATLIYHMVKMNQQNQQQQANQNKKNPPEAPKSPNPNPNPNKIRSKVLVCASSNIAVDQLTEKLHRAGLKVVRLYAKSRESIQTQVDFLSLHKLILLIPNSEELQELTQLKEENKDLTAKQIQKYKELKEQAESIILDAAEVVCTTCVGAGDHRLKRYFFPYVLIDEATQATEPECIIPITRGCKQLILVGDHCQLGPVIMCKKAAQCGMNKSLFERLVCLGQTPYRLQVQYRMHPCLVDFPSNMFYEGTLQNGISVNERQYKQLEKLWPNPAKPMFFYNNSGIEEISPSGTSFLNRTEAANVEKLVTMMLKNSIKPSQIGIVTPYEGQRAYITLYMIRNGTLSSNLYKEIEVASVDSFQGREKDFIILSCVRSNENVGIGFLKDPRRLNVAITRAKYGLIICGSAKVLCKQNQLWNNLITHYKEKDLLVEGPINNLKPSLFQFKVLPKFQQKNELGPSFGNFEDALDKKYIHPFVSKDYWDNRAGLEEEKQGFGGYSQEQNNEFNRRQEM